jgi:hypothetical protein
MQDDKEMRILKVYTIDGKRNVQVRTNWEMFLSHSDVGEISALHTR